VKTKLEEAKEKYHAALVLEREMRAEVKAATENLNAKTRMRNAASEAAMQAGHELLEMAAGGEAPWGFS
jgi:hypothetical protein